MPSDSDPPALPEPGDEPRRDAAPARRRGPDDSATARHAHDGRDRPEPTAADRALAVLRVARRGALQREQAARWLLEAYEARMMGWGRRFRHLREEDVEELVTDTVLKFLDRCPDEWTWPEGWLMTTFYRAACSRAEEREREQARLVPLDRDSQTPERLAPVDWLAADPDGSEPDKRLMRQERWATAREILAYVVGRNPQRASVVFMRVQGRDIEEIAIALGMSKGAVRDMLYEVLKLASKVRQTGRRR